MLTLGNLLCGSAAGVALLAHSNYELAFWLMIASAVCDFFDGMVARLLKVSSPLGLQMDSLADDVTFGFAPATIVFNYMNDVLYYPEYLGCYANVIPYVAFLIAVFSACRLAKFNVDTRQTNTFIGLPTPANALFWSSLITGAGHWIFNLNAGWVLMLGLVIISSYLLVSEIPMFSLKFKNFSWRCNKTRYIFLVVALPMLLLGYLAPVVIIAWYLALSVTLYIKGTRP